MKAHHEGKLTGTDGKSKLSDERMEIGRLRAELAHVRMKHNILGEAPAFFSKSLK